jgi:hypothetical protein
MTNTNFYPVSCTFLESSNFCCIFVIVHPCTLYLLEEQTTMYCFFPLQINVIPTVSIYGNKLMKKFTVICLLANIGGLLSEKSIKIPTRTSILKTIKFSCFPRKHIVLLFMKRVHEDYNFQEPPLLYVEDFDTLY